MNKITIIYPGGQGGHWLSNLIYSLETQNYDIIPTNNNFHKYPGSKSINLKHKNNLENAIGSFSGIRSQFITYLTVYYKWYKKELDIKSLSNSELFYALTNKARWHQDCSGTLAKDYLDNIVIDADLIFTNPVNFANQVFELLNQYNISYTANIDFVLKSVDNYKKTCWSLNKIDISNNIPWLAWCHAMCLLNNITIPMVINEKFDEFAKWIIVQEFFYEETSKRFITHI